jgi:hypothetical protein
MDGRLIRCRAGGPEGCSSIVAGAGPLVLATVVRPTQVPRFSKLATLLASLTLVVGFSGCRDGSPSPDDLQQSITSGLKPGASVPEIEQYIASEGHALGLEDNSTAIYVASDYGDLLDEFGISPDTRVYQTIKRGRNKDWLVFFVLDKDLRFTRVVVVEMKV